MSVAKAVLGDAAATSPSIDEVRQHYAALLADPGAGAAELSEAAAESGGQNWKIDRKSLARLLASREYLAKHDARPLEKVVVAAEKALADIAVQREQLLAKLADSEAPHRLARQEAQAGLEKIAFAESEVSRVSANKAIRRAVEIVDAQRKS